MTKTKGILLTIKAFLPLDRKDYKKQAETYTLLGSITESGKLPDDFMGKVTIIGIETKEGSAELPAVQGDANDPASLPLDGNPLPDGAVVLEATTMLDMTIMQTVKLADGNEIQRRITADQDETERKTDKKRPKNKPVDTTAPAE